jgi:Domain of unknown function (DUF1844)
MAADKEDKGFRVIDRRGREEEPVPTASAGPLPAAPKPEDAARTPGGKVTAGSEDEIPPESAKEGNRSAAPGVQEGQEGGRASEPLAGPRFLDLVQSLQLGAMVNLGMIQGPDGKRSPVDLPAAKDAIDLLGILQDKTKGNLSAEEEEVLREGLYHLRMAYMALVNAPPPGPDQKRRQ